MAIDKKVTGEDVQTRYFPPEYVPPDQVTILLALDLSVQKLSKGKVGYNGERFRDVETGRFIAKDAVKDLLLKQYIKELTGQSIAKDYDIKDLLLNHHIKEFDDGEKFGTLYTSISSLFK